MTESLERSIVRTVAYFSHFSYPLTSFEVWKWLLMPERKYSLAEVSLALDESSLLEKSLSRHGGFIGLGNVELQASDRRDRLKDALRKYEKLNTFLRFLSRLPFIEGIAVCNSLAFHHTTSESDIDLYIVTKPKRTWSARLCSTFPLMLLRQRPGETLVDPLCLSFFASSTAMNLEPIKIAEQDPYLAYWAMTLIPLVDRSGCYREFAEINEWARAVLPHAEPVKRAPAFRPMTRRVFIPIPLKEVLARKLQEDRFPQKIRSLMNLDTRVIVNEHMLKFHDDDRRLEIASALDEKMKAFV
ncbi:MAG: hypothetical protein WC802_02020 [Patescibacteria group bacterium]|jgi:hypothetical protein